MDLDGTSANYGRRHPGPQYHATQFFADTKVAELAEAARDGNLARVDKLVAEGVKLNTKGYEGFTPLIYAMSGETLKGFRRLLERGADPNQQTEGGDSAIYYAAFRQDPEALKLSLAFGGNPNLRCHPKPGPKFDPNGIAIEYLDSRPTPIFVAVLVRSPENARILIKAGADINARDTTFGQTPLFDANNSSCYDVMYVLLEAGADFRAKDNLGHTVSYYMGRYPPRGPNKELAKAREPCVEFMRKREEKDKEAAKAPGTKADESGQNR
jgi:ankyrin repeat protein